MRTLYLDCFSGLSGDMFLGLLLDLGLDRRQLEEELAKLPITDYQLRIGREKRHGIEGCRLRVECAEQHHHRSWSSIDLLLAESALAPEISDLARRFFRRLGAAEGKVHGIAIDQVHFHEVGAVDAIVDLTGAAIGIHLLGIEKLVCAPLPLSRGMTRSAHGPLPLPAPATLELLQGIPIVDSGCARELVTPTGACIVAELAEFGGLAAMAIERTGYGVGGWQLEDRPNLLRGILGETKENGEVDSVCVLETHIDDSTPEALGYLMEQLFDAGAFDVGYTPLQMKKNRPGLRLTVITPPSLSDKISRLILHESSAIGVRRYITERRKLRRELAIVETIIGEAQVKLIYDGAKLVRVTSEFESCRQLAQQSGRSFEEISRIVDRAGQKLLSEDGS